MSKDEDFIGTQTLGAFMKAILAKMNNEQATSVELEMDIENVTVSFVIEITEIVEKS